MRKTREKSKTRAQLYYTMHWVKTRVSCVFLAFFSRFSHVFIAFLFTNANQKHSVIGALVIVYKEKVNLAEERTPDLLHRKQTLYYSAIENCGTNIDHAMVFILILFLFFLIQLLYTGLQIKLTVRSPVAHL